MRKVLLGLACLLVVSGVANALSCSTTMLIGKRWTNIRCEDTNGDGKAETIAWYNHGNDSVSEVVFSRSGVQISRRKLSRQERAPANSSLKAVCPTVSALARTDVWKSRQSNHIPSFDPRKYSTSYIVLRGGRRISSSCVLGYSSTGKLVHKMGAYYPAGSLYNIRVYGGHGCGDRKTPRSVASAAPGGLYLKVAANKCILVPNPNKCYNSSGC